MILPDKNIKLEFSLFACGALILRELEEPKTLSSLWDSVRKCKQIAGFEKFLLTLDYLFIINAISINDGIIVRGENDLLN